MTASLIRCRSNRCVEASYTGNPTPRTTMRIVVAQMSHETNTFSPVVTDLARFSPIAGTDAVDTFRGTASCLGGFITVCEAAGATLELPIAAGAAPSGPVEDA